MSDSPDDTLPNPLVWVVVLSGVILATVVGAIFAVATLWDLSADAAVNAKRNLEVIKASLQLLGVGVFGAIVAALATKIDHSRQRRAGAEQQRAEDFELRSRLLDRSTRCAHAMYVTCQHVAREMKDAAQLPPSNRAGKERAARALLDEKYLEFATEALAVQTEIGARFGISPGPTTAEEPPKEVSPGDSWWRWHQIYDLVTVYYFSLTGSFRSDAEVLKTNSLNYAPTLPDGKGEAGRHSGLNLRESFGAGPPHEHKDGETAIRKEYKRAMPQFAEALLDEPLREPGGPSASAPPKGISQLAAKPGSALGKRLLFFRRR